MSPAVPLQTAFNLRAGPTRNPSWSQSSRKNERGLSINRRSSRREEAPSSAHEVGASSRRLLRIACFRCVADGLSGFSMNRRSQSPPGFGVRQSPGALGARGSRGGEARHRVGRCAFGGKAAGDCRSPRRCRADVRCAGVHGPNAGVRTKRAFQEPCHPNVQNSVANATKFRQMGLMAPRVTVFWDWRPSVNSQRADAASLR